MLADRHASPFSPPLHWPRYQGQVPSRVPDDGIMPLHKLISVLRLPRPNLDAVTRLCLPKEAYQEISPVIMLTANKGRTAVCAWPTKVACLR